MCAKNVGETKRFFVETNGFFCFSLIKRTATKATSKLNTFFSHLFLTNEEKTSEKKFREMFPYQFVAHMPKITQI